VAAMEAATAAATAERLTAIAADMVTVEWGSGYLSAPVMAMATDRTMDRITGLLTTGRRIIRLILTIHAAMGIGLPIRCRGREWA
jgi:hypothetical protein